MASVLLTKQEQLNGTVVYTDFQSNGKGQRGNSWESAKGENILIYEKNIDRVKDKLKTN